MATDEDVEYLFRKLEEVLGHDNAVTLIGLLRTSAAEALHRRIPGWDVRVGDSAPDVR